MSLPVIGGTLLGAVVTGEVGSPPIVMMFFRRAASSVCFASCAGVTYFPQHVQNSLRAIVEVSSWERDGVEGNRSYAFKVELEFSEKRSADKWVERI